MEQVFALEVWLASMAAALSIGWMIGNRNARREEEQGAGERLVDAECDELFSLTVPPKLPARSAAPPARSAKARPLSSPPLAPAAAPARIREERARMALSPAQSRMRSEIFAKMPPVDELREQVRAIRKTNRVWDSPDIGEHLAEFMRVADLGSLEALQHYRTAISELKRSGAPSRGLSSPVASRVPRITDAAPLNPKEPAVRFTLRARDRSDRAAHVPRYAGGAMR